MSVALVEAMAHAIPAISTTTGGQPELLGQGAGSGAAARRRRWRPQLAAYWARPTSAGAGPAGRRRIEQEFDVDIIAAELVRRFAGEPAGDAAAEPAAAGAR